MAAFRPAPPLHPKTAQTLDFIGYRGVCPQFFGERGMGNGERGSRQNFFRPPKISPVRALLRPRARPNRRASETGRNAKNQIPSKAQKSAGLTMKSALG